MSDLHVVLGSAGAVGSLLVAELARAGRPVRAVQRRPAVGAAEPSGVELRVADVGDPAGAAEAVAGAAVVYVCVQPAYTRWTTEFVPLVRTIADAATRAGARLVMLDNLYGYGPVTGPMTEDLPLVATTRKGRARAAIATDLLARHARGDLAVTLGRASDFVGPTGVSIPNLLLLDRAATGRRGRWVGRLDQPHSVSHTVDVARSLAVLGGDERAYGRAWHLPVAPALTGGELVTLTHRLAGVAAGPGLVTPLQHRLAGLFVPDIREGNELMYEFTAPFVVDDADFRRTFGGSATPLEDAVATSLDARRHATHPHALQGA